MKQKSKWQMAATAAGILLLLLMLLIQLIPKRQTAWQSEGNGAPVSDGTAHEAFRMLVVGKDRAASLCDVIMLAYVEPKRQRVSVVQIPRDTFWRYGTQAAGRINGAAARLGGADALCGALGEVLGVSIPYYVELDTDAFGHIVDALGGVRITLPHAMDYEDPADGLSIHLPAGEQLLDGETAQHFVRYRHGYVRGDLGRMDAQKVFLSALLTQARERITLANALSVADAVFGEMQTNLPFSLWLTLCRVGMTVPAECVYMMTMPGKDVRSPRSGAWYYVLCRNACIRSVNAYLGGDVQEQTFDGEKVLLQESYGAFSEIYYGDTETTVYDASGIGENGIPIATID